MKNNQGSHLGRLLFTIFLNEFPTYIKEPKGLMFAGDVTIFVAFKSLSGMVGLH